MDLSGKIINNKYRVVEKIGEGGMSTVWLAEDIFRKENVAVKMLKKGVTSNRLEDIIRFRNEATTVSKLNAPGIVKIYDIGEIDNMHYIVMEHINGKSLFSLIEEGVMFNIYETVEVIYKICDALKHIHSANVVHRDIKPGNIIINNYESELPKSEYDLKLIDFGLAQVKEFSMKDTGEIIGTLNYMAPEQSGIVKRSIDERSDLYSVGIIFYQLLTKVLPFKADSITAVIHQHIAKVPERLGKFVPEIPEILEHIVLKLLEKEPERRYQSAEGLLSDLDKFKKGQIDFVPGIDDKNIKLNYRTGLVGREDEIAKLRSLFEYAQNGRGNICLIGGEAGRGKTRLVEEIRNYCYDKRGVFIDGKCFSGKNKIPYGPLKDAINVYLRTLYKYPEDRQEEIIKKIRVDVGELGEILIKFNPMLEDIIGECPPLITLERDRENKRFLMVVNHFFRTIGELEGVLVISIDDLQWCDEGSIELLNELIKEIADYPVLVLGTYRDNEITPDHALNHFIENVSEKDPLTQINLKPFDSKRMRKFIAGLLFDAEGNSDEISNFIMQKSKGNPFFATEVLRTLVDEKAIVRKNEKWNFNKEILDKIEISSSIVDILLRKITLLDKQDIEILSYAAVIGRKFDMELLFELGDLDKEEIVEVVDRAIGFQLLEGDSEERGKILFVHDRIKEAFYKNIDDDKRKVIHLNIAKSIENLNKDDYDKVIFDLAYHYIESGDKEKGLEYAFPAGMKAKENYANDEAIKYLTVATELIESKSEEGSLQWIECLESIGSIYIMTGKTTDALNLFNKLLPHLKTNVSKANAYRQISYAYFKKGDWKNCEEYGRLGLSVFGEKLPVRSIGVMAAILKEGFIRGLYMFFPSIFKPHRTTSKNEDISQIVWLYYVISWTYSLSGSLKVTSTALKMINYAERKAGMSKELGLSYMVFAVYLAEIPWFSMAIRYHKKALDLRKEINDEWGVAHCSTSMGFYYKCRGEYKKSIDCFKISISIFKRIGDLGELGAGTSGLSGAYIFIADYENGKILNDQYYDMAVKINDNFGITVAWMQDILIYTEKGEYDVAERYGISANKLAHEDKNDYMICMTGAMLGRLYIEKNDIIRAIEYLEISKDLFLKNPKFLKEYTAPLFPYLAEAYILQYMKNKNEMTPKTAKEALKRIKATCKEALERTKLWATYHVCSLRVNARYYALVGNNAKAEDFFMESIKLSRDLERKYELGLGLYEFSLFLEQNARMEEAKKHRENAYNIFKEIGANAYEKRIAELIGIGGEEASSIERFTKELRYNQRLTSILMLTQDISSILDMDELLEKIMSIAIEVTGAQRGYVMLTDEKTKEVKVRVRKNINVNEIGAEGFSSNIIDEVIKKGQSVLTTNAMEDEKYNAFQSVLFNELKSVLCIPIKYKNEITGICYLDNPLSSSVFTEEDIDVLNSIMTQAAISIENAKLYKLAITDGLTELFTHKHFKFLLQKEVERAGRYKRELSMLMFDIDHFKNFNDSYGHQAGDQVLVNISRIARECVRSVDIVGRYGGEEFAVILPETDRAGAEIAAERIRSAVEREEVIYGEAKLKVTISIGVASFPHNGKDKEALIKSADDALYVSKENGRNMVTIAPIKN